MIGFGGCCCWLDSEGGAGVQALNVSNCRRGAVLYTNSAINADYCANSVQTRGLARFCCSRRGALMHTPTIKDDKARSMEKRIWFGAKSNKCECTLL